MFSRILERLGRALEAAGIPYMIVGGQAVLLYGEPRLTRDIDVTVGLGIEEFERVRRAAEGAGLRPLGEDPHGLARETMVFPAEDPESGIRVDFIFSFLPYERQAIGRSRELPVGRARVRFAAPEDVVILKMVAGRSRDLEDVRSILLKNPALDRVYMEAWLEEFGKALERELTAAFRNIASGIGTGDGD